MPVRSANARWEGSLQRGSGVMKMKSGAYNGNYSFASRFEEGTGTNPEELIAAAHSGCFSMALSAELGRAGHEPQSVETTAEVTLERGEAGFSITAVHLTTIGKVPGITQDEFRRVAEIAKAGCPVSRALNPSIRVTLDASLAR
jgi:osmotically inducible protein OsmC